MLVIPKSKWFASIFLVGILLTLAQLHGTWGTDYQADAQSNPYPHIDYIFPTYAFTGSTSKLIIISGANFGNTNDTAVRLQGDGHDVFLYGLVQPDAIWVTIPYFYLESPAIYSITVLICDMGPIPTVPPPPSCYESESNPVPFRVVDPIYIFVPLLSR